MLNVEWKILMFLQGAKVFFTYRTPRESINNIVNDSGGNVYAFQADASNYSQVVSSVEEAVKVFGKDENATRTLRRSEKFVELLASGFVDTFRLLHPNEADIYSWWSYRMKARERNVGWRIDYFLVSDSLKKNVRSAAIHNEVFGSDHCPVSLELEV